MSGQAIAQLHDVGITVAKKKLDEEKSREGGNKTVTTKEIVYTISVQNKRFKTMPEIQVKYMIFLNDEQAGSTEAGVVKAHTGSESVQNLASNASVTIETKPIRLATEDLDGGWAYYSGAGNRARDKVNGVWVRAYADGKIIGEYANPSTVTRKNTWKD